MKQAPFNHQENRDNVSCSGESNNVSRAITLAKQFGIKGRVLVFVKQTKKLDCDYRLNRASKNPYIEILNPVLLTVVGARAFQE